MGILHLANIMFNKDGVGYIPYCASIGLGAILINNYGIPIQLKHSYGKSDIHYFVLKDSQCECEFDRFPVNLYFDIVDGSIATGRMTASFLFSSEIYYSAVSCFVSFDFNVGKYCIKYYKGDVDGLDLISPAECARLALLRGYG